MGVDVTYLASKSVGDSLRLPGHVTVVGVASFRRLHFPFAFESATVTVAVASRASQSSRLHFVVVVESQA